jgi:riboflavin biosynthesis pyrimidine reductase
MPQASPMPVAIGFDLNRYAFPDDVRIPYVVANFVCSVDGAAAVGGSSEPLTSPQDQAVLFAARNTCDVVLVGLNTANAGQYWQMSFDPAQQLRNQLAEFPSLAVVSNTCRREVLAPFVAISSKASLLVITNESVPAARRKELEGARVSVLVCGAEQVDLRIAIAGLQSLGLCRVSCEGGPRLFGSMIEEDLVDELRLTIGPS